jgi:hypothetical protein
LISLDVHHADHDCDLPNPPDESSDTATDYWRSPIFDADPGPASTNLKTLRFTLCEIHPTALGKILSFPRDLEHFTLTYHKYLDYEHKKVLPRFDLVVEALEQQQHSLVHGFQLASARSQLGSFKRLERLDIDFEMWLGGLWNEHAAVTADGGKPSFELDKLFPPCLKQLTFRFGTIEEPVCKNVQQFEFLRRIATDQARLLPNLQCLGLIEAKLASEAQSSSHNISDEIDAKLVAMKQCFKANGIEMFRETKLVEADPYSPRLRNMMGRLGNRHYPAS